MIKNYTYLKGKDERDLNRSPYRNMNSKCKDCGYRQRPSLVMDTCSNCKVYGYNNKGN